MPIKRLSITLFAPAIKMTVHLMVVLLMAASGVLASVAEPHERASLRRRPFKLLFSSGNAAAATRPVRDGLVSSPAVATWTTTERWR